MHLPLAPEWFLHYDELFELLFAGIALLVSYFSFKVYKIAEQRQANLLGVSFFFIALSYLAEAVVHSAILVVLQQDISLFLKINSIYTLITIGSYAYSFLFLAGIFTLAYMTIGIRNLKSCILFFSLTLSAVLLAADKTYSFQFLTSLLLAFIVIHYILNFLQKRKLTTLLVMTSFVFLLLSKAHYFITVKHAAYYGISHVLELIAYMLILINLFVVLKNDQKT